MNASPNPVAMPVADKDNLLTLLHDTRLRFLSSLAGVSDDASRLRPAEGCWSVLDCVEHIAGAEAFMFRILKESRHPRSADAPNREEDFLRRMVDRSVKARTPERGQPRGRFANLEEARNQFVTARGATIAFVKANTEDLRAMGVPHPIFGDVSAYEMLIIMAKHAERHALQIEEIRKAIA
jgi:uncharacterized damage-inducible protein DinB